MSDHHPGNCKEHHRASAHELHLETRINGLMQGLQMLNGALRSAFPTANFPDVSAYMYSGRTMSYFSQPTDEDMLYGRGPRFIATYTLAESDAERQALLNTLSPHTDGLRSTPVQANIRTLTRDYRFANTTNGSDFTAAPEFTQWLKEARANNAFTPLDGNDLRVLGEMSIQGISTFLWTPPPTTQRDNYGKVQPPTVYPPIELVVVPVPEAQGYVIIRLNLETSSGTTAMVPSFCHWLTWMEIEKCWCLTNGSFFNPAHQLSVAERFLEFVGMPKLDMPTIEETIDACTRMFDYVQSKVDEWKDDLDVYGPVRTRKVVLPGVIELSFDGKRSWSSAYDKKDRYTYKLLDPAMRSKYGDRPEMVATWMDDYALVPLVRWHTDRNENKTLKWNLNVHPRNQRAVLNCFIDFLDADPDRLLYEDEPNPDYRPRASGIELDD